MKTCNIPCQHFLFIQTKGLSEACEFMREAILIKHEFCKSLKGWPDISCNTLFKSQN